MSRPPRPRAGAALALTGRYAGPASEAAEGLRAWAAARGVELTIADSGADPRAAAAAYLELGERCDLLLGPYGSGHLRAVAAALEDRPWVLWNHGGAAGGGRRGRVVDVLAPADRYWAGLAGVLAQERVDLSGVAVLHATSGFGRETARGAVDSLRRAGASPLLLAPFSEATAAGAARAAIARGASVVVGCGRIEDDLALGRALAGSGLACGLIVCGVALAHEQLGDAVEGWIGPAQWLPGAADPPVPLAPGLDYPAAQALAAGLIAEDALARAGSPDPDLLWREALRLRTRTFLGPFAVDRRGRQTAHAPLIVRWRRRDGELRREAVWRTEWFDLG